MPEREVKATDLRLNLDSWSLRRLIEDDLNAEPVRMLAKGGSAALVIEIRMSNGERRVVKYAEERDGLVDGHDLLTFHTKNDQIDAVRREAHRLSPHYVEILDRRYGNGWAAVIMPFYSGTDLALSLRERADVDAFFRSLDQVLQLVTIEGYSVSCLPAPPDEVCSTHLSRVSRRSHFFTAHLPDDLVEDDIIINEMMCRTPGHLIQTIKENRLWVSALTPSHLWFPVHGDLNTRNVLIDDSAGTFVLIDPRGTTDHWDPMYDLSKLLFSLTTWDLSLRNGFVILQDGGHSKNRYHVRLRQSSRAYQLAAHAFPLFVTSQSDLARLLGFPSTVVLRLLFAHAISMVAEAACRLSDIRHRSRESGEAVSPLELAMGHYLLGRLLLEDIVRSFEQCHEIDINRHFALLY